MTDAKGNEDVTEEINIDIRIIDLEGFLKTHKNQRHVDLIYEIQEEIDIDLLNACKIKDLFKDLLSSL